jgi:aspartyl-tRNA(Asn)/glutamyl-tRNA(Gln) amidotransferase subunit A
LLRERRARLIEAARRRLDGFDAIICPTTPILAPPLAALADDDEYARINLLALRNPTVISLLDGCAVSVPIHEHGDPPAGMMVAGLADDDETVLRIGAWIEERVWPS